ENRAQTKEGVIRTEGILLHPPTPQNRGPPARSRARRVGHDRKRCAAHALVVTGIRCEPTAQQIASTEKRTSSAPQNVQGLRIHLAATVSWLPKFPHRWGSNKPNRA